MSGYYAANDQVSREPIEGGIEITADEYRQGIEALAGGKVVRIDGGVFSVQDKPQATTYWLAANDERQTDPGEPVPDGASTEPPPSPYHSLVDGAWTEDADALERADAALSRQIDGKASEVRGRFITAGVGQEATYLEKYEEAKAYKTASSPADSDYPLLNAESTRRGLTMTELADEVIARRTSWIDPVAANVEAERVGGKDDVRAATTVAGKEEARDAAITALEAIEPE